MKLLLMQHGEALSKQDNPERPLSARGQVDVDKLGEFLSRAGIRVERIIHSGKLRAMQTAEIMANNLACNKVEQSELINPNDNVSVFFDSLSSQQEDQLVVGHLPFMARLVSHACGADQQTLVAYLPGSLVCLEKVADEWLIDWMLRPELF